MDNQSSISRARSASDRFSHFASGVVAASITPYKQDGTPDIQAASSLYKHMFTHGVDGVFVASSTGEAEMLGAADRESLVAAARDAAGEQGAVFVGVTSLGVGDTVQLANRMKQAGADCGVVMAPAFLKYTQPELVSFFQRIADASELPIAVYHHPRSSNPIAVDTVVALAEHANVVAVKDTSGVLERAVRLLEAVEGADIRVLQGSEHLILESLSKGAVGMVTALAGVAPEWHASLFKSWRNGEHESAAVEQERLQRLWQMFGIESLGESVSCFTKALKIGLARRQWLPRETTGMFPSIRYPAEFIAAVEQHYDTVGLPSERRIHQPHPSANGPVGGASAKSVSA